MLPAFLSTVFFIVVNVAVPVDVVDVVVAIV